MRALDDAAAGIGNAFSEASKPPTSSRKAKATNPFSIRLSEEERTFLEERAGNRPLGAYIREILLGEHEHKRRAIRRPQIEDTQYSSLLAALGHSNLSSNLNQLARHANVGSLDVSGDIEQQLQDACAAVMIMRKTLLIAMGLKVGSVQ